MKALIPLQDELRDSRFPAVPTPRLGLVFGLLGLLGVLLAGAALPALAQRGADVGQAPAGDGIGSAPDTTAPSHRVIAYYLHTTQRCASCRKIEAYTTEAIESNFADALKDGRLVFEVVNVEEKGNEHFVKDFQLFTKSVVLVDEHSGKQTAWKNLPKVWELLNDKEKFVGYIQKETEAYLSGTES